MGKIKIITDSTCDLPLELINKHNIEVLPLTVHFGDEAYRDGVDITVSEFFEKMSNSGVFPTTSQINPQTFYECYKRYLSEGYEVISIHISSNMSGTYQSAVIAKGMLDSENIIVIDSRNVTSGLGLLVLKACQLRSMDCKLEDIHSGLMEMIPHIKSALSFESLDNLVKGGRISKAAGVVGGLLGIRLILEVKDGEMAVLDKVRGNKKAIKAILDRYESRGNKQNGLCALLHVQNKDIREALKESLEGMKADYFESEVGCVVGTHSGVGACGIFFVENY